VPLPSDLQLTTVQGDVYLGPSAEPPANGSTVTFELEQTVVVGTPPVAVFDDARTVAIDTAGHFTIPVLTITTGPALTYLVTFNLADDDVKKPTISPRRVAITASGSPVNYWSLAPAEPPVVPVIYTRPNAAETITGQWQFQIAPLGPGGTPLGSGGSGTSDHNVLTNRSADNQHPMSAITGLVAALAGKQATGSYLTTAQRAAVNGVAPLDGTGKVPTANLPSLAVGDTYTVATTSALTSLTAADMGDIGIVEDNGNGEPATYRLAGTGSPLVLANWVLLPSPFRDRATHIGTQPRSTISDFDAGVDARIQTKVIAGTNVTVTTDGSGNRVISSTAGGGGGGSSAYTVVAKTAGYTLTAADFDGATLLALDSASDQTLTVPAGLSVTAGQFVTLAQRGTGRWVVTPGSTVGAASKRATFETGTDGAPIAGAFDSSAGTMLYEADAAFEGNMGAVANLVASTASYGGFTTTGTTQTFRWVGQIPAAPMTYNARIIRGVQGSGVMSWEIRATTSGVLDLINTAGTAVNFSKVSGGATFSYAAGTTYTLEGSINSSTGAYLVNIYAGRWTGTGATVATITGTATTFAATTEIRFGNMNGAATTSSIRFDDVAVGTALPIGAGGGVAVRAVGNEMKTGGQYAETSLRCDATDVYWHKGETAA
jgi:hypothetical protein